MQDKPSVHREGRRCKFKGCNKPLSIYNAGPYCYRHAAKVRSAKLEERDPDLALTDDELKKVSLK